MILLSQVEQWLHERLPGLLAEHKIPGAAVAVSVGDEVVDHAAGVLNTATGVAATADSIFQVGSITKVWTSTLAMQLADGGELELDAPVRRYLPGFRLADEAAAAAVTVRQLMSHTAGFEGDIFTDTGRNDDCVEKYVDSLAEAHQVFAPGAMFSYNNAGFGVLGRIIEVLRGKPFAACLRERLIAPLGLTHTAIGAEQAILFRAAAGHLPLVGDGPAQPVPVWNLPASSVAAGSLLTMRARDVLGFARMHLRGGLAADGTALLSPRSAAAMREPQVELPPLPTMGDAWGLGWAVHRWPGGTVVGHVGGTFGQSAFLRLVPERDVAIALLANGGDVVPAYAEIFGFLLRELAGVQMPALLVPPAAPEPVEAVRYAGTYTSPAADLVVSGDQDGRLWLLERPKGVFAQSGEPPEREEFVRLDGETFVGVTAQQGVHGTVVFLGDDGQGHSLYLHGGRASRRLAGL